MRRVALGSRIRPRPDRRRKRASARRAKCGRDRDAARSHHRTVRVARRRRAVDDANGSRAPRRRRSQSSAGPSASSRRSISPAHSRPPSSRNVPARGDVELELDRRLADRLQRCRDRLDSHTCGRARSGLGRRNHGRESSGAGRGGDRRRGAWYVVSRVANRGFRGWTPAARAQSSSGLETEVSDGSPGAEASTHRRRRSRCARGSAGAS